MNCIFNPEIVCPIYAAQKELGYEPNQKEIREKACPQCPNSPNRFKKNEDSIRQIVPSHGNYIF